MIKHTHKTDARDKNLFELLNTKKYIVDYFQREYKWERKHIEQLIIDLEDAFFYSYKSGDNREEVENYESYFMGPVILYKKTDGYSIIDGQQRLTSLTLLLIYINNLQKEYHIQEEIDSLIFSKKYNKASFNISIPERQNMLESLYNEDNSVFNENEKNISLRNMLDRYNDIIELFPESIKNEDVLPFFIDWLKYKLTFVEIVAYSDRNAYTIFETMNDRGLNLTPSEMLKSFLLSKSDGEEQDELNEIWRNQISTILSLGKDQDLEFFRAWFRGKYAETIRQSSAGSTNEDFEKIGTSFHRWVKDRTKLIGLTTEQQFYFFVKSDFVFYSNLYILIKNAEKNHYPKLNCIRLSTEWTIASSLAYPLYLAPINKIDDTETITDKLAIVAKFIDNYVVIRSVNNSPISQTSIRYSIYNLVKKIRGASTEDLRRELNSFLSSQDESINKVIAVNQYTTNRKFLRYLLARLTLKLHSLCNQHIDFYDLISARRRNGCIVSPILDNIVFENSEYTDIEDFDDDMHNIGMLGLLRKDLSIDSNEANIFFRIGNGHISDEEREKLSQYFNIPITASFSKDFLHQRQKFIEELSTFIWGNKL